jgi:dethiobiotin synthetase
VAAPLVVVTGTGTGIGKTHVAAALLHAWRGLGVAAVGWKPVETGVDADRGPGPDQTALAAPFHVKPLPGAVFAPPVSPHLAARRAGTAIDLDTILVQAAAHRGHVPALVVELAGGLCTPLCGAELNLHLAERLAPDRLVLVAPDRLGVLHDVLAACRAAAGTRLRIHAVVLSAPELADASTGSNGPELAELLQGVEVLCLSRASPEALARALRPLVAPLVAAASA